MSPRAIVITAALGIVLLGSAAALILNLVDATGSVSALVVVLLAVVAGLVGSWLAERVPPPQHRE
jgi:uncharacterized membrane protein YfcA